MNALPEGRDPASPYSRHVTARLLDFTSPTTPWTRRLWDVGAFLALEELHEAGEWVDGGVLHQSAVDWQRNAMEKILGADPAIGTRDVRRRLQETLRTTLTVAGDGRRRLRCLIDTARPGYLARWSDHVAAGTAPGPERVARAVTAHLLDSGHSPSGLHRWLQDGRTRLSAAELVGEAAELLAAPTLTWEVIVPFRALPDHEEMAAHLSYWIPAHDAQALLQKAGMSARRTKVAGAMRYRIAARDVERAIEIAYDLVERLQARARFRATSGRVVPLDQVVIDGWHKPLPLRMPARGVHVRSLASKKRLYAVQRSTHRHGQDERSPLDDALEIASALNEGPLAPALAGGWAALESLLTESRDPDERGKIVAAERAAALVACSWPRAELTALSYQVRQVSGDDLTGRLDACGSNHARATLLADRLRERRALPLVRSWRLESDVAALRRMLDVVDRPRPNLDKVRERLEVSLRRLYRCRNIVLHGGSTGGVALSAALRAAAPLVGAALDRITHAHLATGVSPLMLAARADTALQLVGDDLGPHVCDLIE
ncbi:hypothetical protein GCM10023085_47300 [Actinomadura viridis]|uniref:Integrase n=1 Tax=Actinomadura viridis TaxID=58110 RepID=A0A931GSF6_9ACTN|nr:hypothetical protein [Actinomadura viridis]MBG6090769.1 hypothetical protein [Actinomadura viridis]